MEPSIAIERNNLKPSYSGNRSCTIYSYFRCLKTNEITCDGHVVIALHSGYIYSMNFNDFRSSLLCFSLKCQFPMIKSSLSGNTIYMNMRLLSIKGLNAVRPGFNCFISMIISVASRCGFQPSHGPCPRVISLLIVQ